MANSKEKETLKIEYLKVGELKPYKNNARKHADEDVLTIMESIKEFGFSDPIGIWSDENIIVEGHGRLIAAKKLGMKEVPVIRLDHLTDEQRRAYALAHNKTAEMSMWDEIILPQELDNILNIDMSNFGFDLDFDTDGEPEEIVEDEVPEIPEEPTSRLGDLYILGDHRLLCGDSTNQADVDRLMDGQKADMVFTDTLWNVNYGAQENHPSWKQRSIMNDFMGTEEFKTFMFSIFKCMNTASKDGAMTYVVMSAQEWGNMMLTLAMNDYHWSSTIIWKKDRLVLSRKDYHTQYEPIWYGWKEGASRLHPLTDRKQSDVWDFERPSKSDIHPMMKPVALVARALTNSSDKDNVILDLFGGSGTTLMASEQTGRKCRMMELDPRYVDAIVKRWEDFTGKKAELIRSDDNDQDK